MAGELTRTPNEIGQISLDVPKNIDFDRRVESMDTSDAGYKSEGFNPDNRIESNGERIDIPEQGEQKIDIDQRIDIQSKTCELSNDEVNALQKEAIENEFNKIKNIEDWKELPSAEKGNLGEMLMDQYFVSKGFTPLKTPRVTDIVNKAGKGLDGVFERINPDGTKEFIIADAKVNTSRLNILDDGTKQMSDPWIYPVRLDEAVGKEKADEIRNAYEDNSDSVKKEIYSFKTPDNYSDGMARSFTETVDEYGNINDDRRMVKAFNNKGKANLAERTEL